MKVVATRNLYLSSDSGVRGSGTDFELYLPSHGFTVPDGQFMRFTVQSLVGYKNFTDVNATNCNCYFQTTVSGTTTQTILALTKTNHPNTKTLAADFATKLKTVIDTDTSTSTTTITNNTVAEDDNTQANDRKMNLSFTNVPITLTDLKVYFYRVAGNPQYLYDTHLLLGGKSNDNVLGTIQGLNIQGVGTNTLTVKSFYPLQRTTMSHVYLRSSLITDSYQNHHFDAAASAHDNYLIQSTILCKAPIHREFFAYDDMNSQGTGYLVNVNNKSLTNISFKLTTDKDFDLPIETDQATLGNASVQLVLRMDVLEAE